MTDTALTPAGWYDDGQHQLRWWDGTRWTEHTAPLTQGVARSPIEDEASTADKERALPVQIVDEGPALLHLDGYGTSVEFDGTNITLIAGKVEAKLWGTDRVTFPVTDIITIEHRPANPAVNGRIRFETVHPAEAYVADPTRTLKIVPDNALTIAWRRKDRAAFDALYAELAVFADPAEVDAKRVRRAEAKTQFEQRRAAAIANRMTNRPSELTVEDTRQITGSGAEPRKPERPKVESYSASNARTEAERAKKLARESRVADAERAAKKLANESRAAAAERERAKGLKKHARDVAKANKSFPKRHAEWEAVRDEAAYALDYVTNFTPTGGEYFTTTANLIEQHAAAAQYVGGSQGISIPFGSVGGHSVRYRVGAARGHMQAGPMEDRVIDTGRVKITPDSFIFIGSNNTRTLPFAKLVDVTIEGTEVRISASNRTKPTRLRLPGDAVTKFLLAAHLAQADASGTRADLVANIAEQARDVAAQEPLIQV